MKTLFTLSASTFSLLLIFVFSSCDKGIFTEQNTVSIDFNKPESVTIPVEEALASMDQLIDELYGNTKSGRSYSLEVFGGVQTKSTGKALPDTSLYIVNFGEEDGYAILAAQSKIKTKIFCITEGGSLRAQDIQDAIRGMESAVWRTKSHRNEDEDYFVEAGRKTVPSIIASSLINQWYNNCHSEEKPNETKSNSYSGTPNTSAMLSTKWHQDTPFNDFRSDGASAGSVAVATAQIIEFNARKYGYSTFNDGTDFDWDLLNTVHHCSTVFYEGTTAAQQEASDFLQYVGLWKNCRIQYNNHSTGYADGAKRTFNNMGYHSVHKYLGFEEADKNRAIAQLTNGFPMYMDGDGPEGGHSWVLDGIFVRQVYGEYGDYLRTEKMFHINWGFGFGMDDGYYIQGIFDTSQKQDIETGVDWGFTGVSASFTWNYRTIKYSL